MQEAATHNASPAPTSVGGASRHRAGVGKHRTSEPVERRKKRINVLALIAALLTVAGTTVLLYPSAAQWFDQLRQSRIVSAYEKIASHAEPKEAIQIQRAREYNALLAGEQLVDIAGHVPTIREKARTPEQHGIAPYEQQLRADYSGLMGRVIVPAADIDLPIYHGSTDATLLKGAGHLQGTALPVGGPGTRAVVTAHRGLANSAMFTYLDRANKGDEFIFQIFGETLAYRIIDIEVVAPDDTKSIKAVPGKDLATLITCTPLGINTHRIVVTGEHIYPTPPDAKTLGKAASSLPHFPWWAVIWSVVFVLACAFVWFSRIPVASKRRDDEGSSNQAVAVTD
ncbi:sortase A [Arcanobacterium wilhelmae]|uniref:Sortase A n=1 Tax=Arcanobacterium wilhelmae TaxID=1803177 RepID=A0ABT9NC26_9ACTO|nr:class C sortase [Arcanobacterium wilhelmae]MDP9801045.1 sortase A [Arcanobacterium wilhelmae]WFN90402.1 class C sortase [Arcanobacterium wilhelmae]